MKISYSAPLLCVVDQWADGSLTRRPKGTFEVSRPRQLGELLLHIFILLLPDSVIRQLLDDPHTFHFIDYFALGGIRICLGVSRDPMFLWISSNSCPLNLLLVRTHQEEIIIVKRLIQGRNNLTMVGVEPRSYNQGRR